MTWVLYLTIIGVQDKYILERFNSEHQCVVAGNKAIEFFAGGNMKIAKYKCFKISE